MPKLCLQISLVLDKFYPCLLYWGGINNNNRQCACLARYYETYNAGKTSLGNRNHKKSHIQPLIALDLKLRFHLLVQFICIQLYAFWLSTFTNGTIFETVPSRTVHTWTVLAWQKRSLTTERATLCILKITTIKPHKCQCCINV